MASSVHPFSSPSSPYFPSPLFFPGLLACWSPEACERRERTEAAAIRFLFPCSSSVSSFYHIFIKNHKNGAAPIFALFDMILGLDFDLRYVVICHAML